VNGSKEEDCEELRVRIWVNPAIYRTLKVACWILWFFAVQQCVQLYFRPIAVFDIPIAIFLLVLAGAFHLYCLWATKRGLIEKIRREKAKQQLNCGTGLRRENERSSKIEQKDA
jgi:TRAP-type C4-dicarboxylate transport system permease small subunit